MKLKVQNTKNKKKPKAKMCTKGSFIDLWEKKQKDSFLRMWEHIHGDVDETKLNKKNEARMTPLRNLKTTLGGELVIVKCGGNGIRPIKWSVHSEGYSLFSAEKKQIQPRETKCIRTDIALSLPRGKNGVVKKPMFVCSQMRSISFREEKLDGKYTGNICAYLTNNGVEPCFLDFGMEIGLLVLE